MDSKKLFFGLKRSKPDDKDKLVSICQAEKIELPSSFSLKDKVKQVYDQLTLNSCSANAAANFLSIAGLDCSISRLYMYFCTRYVDNNYMMPIADNGATLRSVFIAMSSYHYVEEVKYPYLIEKVDSIPPREVFEEAITVNKSPITSYRQILPSEYAIKYIISQCKKPVLFGMMVYSNFFRLTKENDILSLPSSSDEMLGGHAVILCGFDDASKTFEILNSHGSEFGNNGYFRLKYEYALNKDLCFEFYTVS